MMRVTRSRVETWAPSLGVYEVSDLGRVRNSTTGRVLSPGIAKGGYLFVILTVDGVATNYKVHKLVISAFSSEVCGGRDVNHIDGVKKHNGIANLEYCTRSYNLQHAFTMGLKTHKGAHNPRSKYSQHVDETRAYLVQGCRHTDIATFLKVPMHFVADVSSARNWA